MIGTVLLLIAVCSIALYGFSEASAQTAAVTAGTVFSDVNRNGILDAGEAGLADIRVLCVPHFQHNSPIWITTDNSGQYRFETQAGCYLTQANVPDWATGDPDAHAYTAAHAGQTVTIYFASWQADRCLPGHDLTGGECVDRNPTQLPPPTCGPGQELVSGQCVTSQPTPLPPPTCGPGQELVSGQCVDRLPTEPDVVELANAIKTLTAAIEEIRQKLVAQDVRIAELSTLSDSLAAQSVQIADLEQTIVTQNAEIAVMEQSMAEHDAIIESWLEYEDKVSKSFVLWPIEDKGDFIPIYQDTNNTYYTQIKNWYQNQQFLENAAYRLNLTLALKHDVYLTMAECGEANAYWSHRTQSVVLCYEYIEDTKNRLTKYFPDHYTDNVIWNKVGGNLTYVLLHELGHGLTDVYKLPIVGREEDAVDQFAAIVMLEYMELDGLQAIIATIEQYNSSVFLDVDPPSYFAGRHSLDEQRTANFLCWAYGDNPDLYDVPSWRTFFDQFGFDKPRLNWCIVEYAEQSHNWYRMIKPFLKDSSIQPPGSIPYVIPPTVIYAWIAGSNVIVIEFSDVVFATVAHFTDMRIDHSPRNITDISGSGTKYISVAFSGPSAPANATGTIDIAGTITDMNGNAMVVGFDDYPIDAFSR